MSELASGRWLLGPTGLVREADAGAHGLASEQAKPGASFAAVFEPGSESRLSRARAQAVRSGRVALALDLAGGAGPATVVIEPAPGGTSAVVVALAPAGGLAASEVEAIAHGVAHDLGAHVRSLASFASFLHEDAGPTLTGGAREDLARIDGALARLRAGLEGLVRYLRAPRDNRGEGSLLQAATDAVHELEPAVNGRGGALAVEGEDARVPFTTAGLAGLLRSLIQNALEQGGQRVRVTLSRTGDRARAVVSDDGPGLAPDELARAVQPFTRLRPRAPGELHPGLGLATVARAARASGGALELGLSERGGVEARLELPVLPRDGGDERSEVSSRRSRPGVV